MNNPDKVTVRERVAALRDLMRREGVDAYLILTDDYHASEYVDDFFKCRAWVSGFRGSAGTLIVTAEEAGLWTDGRYFLAAEEQLRDTGIELRKMGEPGVPTINDYLTAALKEGRCLGYDGRTVSGAYAARLKKTLEGRRIRFAETLDLVGELWTDRPPFPAHPVWELEERYAGKSRADKLGELREAMRGSGADRHLLASLDDVAWLYNLRGGDVAFSPVFMAYTLVGPDGAVLYAAPEAFSDELKARLRADGVEIRPYLQVYEDLKTLPEGEKLLLNRARTNVALLCAVPERVTVIDGPNPSTLAKAVKNPVEMDNVREAHVQDGVALVKTMRWLHRQEESGAIARGEITELDVCEKLLRFRSERPGFVDLSFSPIVAAGEHGAIVHYEPTEESNVPLRRDSFLLMDTGGHYLQGSTDVTRTVAVGTLSEEQKTHFTAVLRGHLDVAAAVFKHGCTGVNLDLLAREPLWELGLDYNHGTGHGVGYLLNVHEGPQGLRLKDLNGGAVFEEGMLTSDEPGLYLEGRYGVRTENLMLCVEKEKTAYGRFMGFEMVTMAPYDRRAIRADMLTERELAQLNAYHAKVYEKLAPWLDADERAWLREETAPIAR
ncbi:MAG: aminopeptidase P family protein [Oscillospiraceae bacterium]|nr:aminopeptidase P family protein [Oscillospiraceae bacterium]